MIRLFYMYSVKHLFNYNILGHHIFFNQLLHFVNFIDGRHDSFNRTRRVYMQ